MNSMLDNLLIKYVKNFKDIYIVGEGYYAEFLYLRLSNLNIRVAGFMSEKGVGHIVNYDVRRLSQKIQDLDSTDGMIAINENGMKSRIEKLYPSITNILWISPGEFDEVLRNGYTEDKKIFFYDYGIPVKAENDWFAKFLHYHFSDTRETFHLYSVYGENKQVCIPRDGIKIFYSCETLSDIPENPRNPRTTKWNHCLPYVDLSMSYEKINEYNYLQFPFWILTTIPPESSYEDIKNLLRSIEDNRYPVTDECACICRHDRWGTRTMVYECVKDLFDVKFAGNWRNNTHELAKKFYNSKINYLKQFRFTICAENMNAKDYCTEKIFDAFKADCIPLYYGANNHPCPEVLNKNSIIFFDKDSKNSESRRLIYRLMKDPSYYSDFMSQNKFQPDAAEYIYENYINALRKRIKTLIDIRKRATSSFKYWGNQKKKIGEVETVRLNSPIILPALNNDYHFFAYPITKKHARYNILIGNIEADFDLYTIGIYDHENKSKIKYIVTKTNEDVFFNFDTGDNVKSWVFVIYAGVAGHTRNQSLRINKFEIRIMQLTPDD